MPSLPRGCPVTLSLIAINLLLFAGQFATQDSLTNMGLLYGPYVQGGQYWRILTSGFLHGSILHIGFNMYLLYMLGPQMEQGFGSLRFSLMYFGSLFGGALAVLLFGFTQPTLGASGAVLGLAGAMFVALWGRGVSPQPVTGVWPCRVEPGIATAGARHFVLGPFWWGGCRGCNRLHSSDNAR